MFESIIWPFLLTLLKKTSLELVRLVCLSRVVFATIRFYIFIDGIAIWFGVIIDSLLLLSKIELNNK